MCITADIVAGTTENDVSVVGDAVVGVGDFLWNTTGKGVGEDGVAQDATESKGEQPKDDLSHFQISRVEVEGRWRILGSETSSSC